MLVDQHFLDQPSLNQTNPKNITYILVYINYGKQNNLLIANIRLAGQIFMPRRFHPRITADILGFVATRRFFLANEIHGYPRTLKTNIM